MEWIAALNRDALLDVERTARTLRLRYAIAALPRVHALVEMESACCAFLAFEVTSDATSVSLVVRAPDSEQDEATSLFDDFTATTPTGTGCACSQRRLEQASNGPRSAKVAATASAVAAMACGACCVVPFVFPALALTSFGAAVSALAGVYWWAVRLAVAAMAAGWLWLLVDAHRRRRRPSRAMLMAMAMASSLVLLASGWSLVEPYVIAWVRGA